MADFGKCIEVSGNWISIGTVSGSYDTIDAYFNPDDKKFYADYFHWNMHGDEEFHDGCVETDADIIWNTFEKWPWCKNVMLRIKDEYGISYERVER